MTVRKMRRILNSLAAVCVLGIGCVVLWSLTTPSLPEPETPRLRRPTESGNNSHTASVTQQQLASVWNTRLQRSLQDVAPTVVESQPTRPAPEPRPPAARFNPRFELLATVIDPAGTLAIITDARGQTDLKGVGETLQLIPGGLTIEDIQPGHVTLSHRGETFNLTLKDDAGSSSDFGSDPAERATGSRRRRGRERADR